VMRKWHTITSMSGTAALAHKAVGIRMQLCKGSTHDARQANLPGGLAGLGRGQYPKRLEIHAACATLAVVQCTRSECQQVLLQEMQALLACAGNVWVDAMCAFLTCNEHVGCAD
jgi:hypothetical protein